MNLNFQPNTTYLKRTHLQITVTPSDTRGNFNDINLNYLINLNKHKPKQINLKELLAKKK